MRNDVPVDLNKPAGFWIRVLASLIDFAVFIPLGFIGWWANQRGSIPVMIAINIPFLVYKPLMESRYGATLGKMVCRIQVRDQNGEYISVKTAFLRFIPFLVQSMANLALVIHCFQNADYLSAGSMQEKALIMRLTPLYSIKQLATLFLTLDCLVVAFRKHKKAIHDSIAGTLCVYKKKDSQQSHAEATSETAPSAAPEASDA